MLLLRRLVLVRVRTVLHWLGDGRSSGHDGLCAASVSPASGAVGSVGSAIGPAFSLTLGFAITAVLAAVATAHAAVVVWTVAVEVAMGARGVQRVDVAVLACRMLILRLLLMVLILILRRGGGLGICVAGFAAGHGEGGRGDQGGDKAHGGYLLLSGLDCVDVFIICVYDSILRLFSNYDRKSDE